MDVAFRPAFAAARTELSRMLRPITGAFQIRDERPRDAAAREVLLDRSFGPERFGKTCERLREHRLPAPGMSFVAMADGVLVGTLRFWHVEAGDRASLLLGPLAVNATHRAAGLGRALIVHGLARAKKLGHESVILVGDAPYYGRFGFARAPAEHLVLPGPVDLNRFLGLELVPGALQGARGRVVGAGLIVDRRGSEDLRRAA